MRGNRDDAEVLYACPNCDGPASKYIYDDKTGEAWCPVCKYRTSGLKIAWMREPLIRKLN